MQSNKLSATIPINSSYWNYSRYIHVVDINDYDTHYKND